MVLTDDIAGRVLRFHRALPWREDDVTGATDGNIIYVQAMVAALRSVRTDELVGVHCTALTAEGAKREPRAKRMRGCARGVAVKFDADEDITLGLTIAEGIEVGAICAGARLSPGLGSGSSGAIETFSILGRRRITHNCSRDRRRWRQLSGIERLRPAMVPGRPRGTFHHTQARRRHGRCSLGGRAPAGATRGSMTRSRVPTLMLTALSGSSGLMALSGPIPIRTFCVVGPYRRRLYRVRKFLGRVGRSG